MASFKDKISEITVRSYWDEPIKSWWVEEESFDRLRFVMRDDKPVLQARYIVHVAFEKDIENQSRRIWLDIPVEEEK